MTEPLLTDKGMAEHLGKTIWFVQKHCRPESPSERKPGKPARVLWPHLRVGKSIRFTPEHVAAIDALLEVGKPAPVVATAAEKFGRRGRSA